MVEQDAETSLRIVSECAVPAALAPPLPAFFNAWMEHAMDTSGEFQLRLCALAIARLLCSKHAVLQQIEVCGAFDARADHALQSSARSVTSGLNALCELGWPLGRQARL